MTSLYNAQKTLKAGFYLDYYFKKFFFFIFKKIFQNSFFSIVNKFVAEDFFSSIKKFYNFIIFVIELIKKTKGLTLLKIFFFISLQIFIIIIL
jgi:hypothetical protein